MISETTGVIIGLILTLFIYSYVVKDNPLYRVAVNLLVGTSAAYAAIIAWRSVVYPVLSNLSQNASELRSWLWLIPILFAVLLLLKLIPLTARAGDYTVASMLGIGAAVALVGAVTGTIWPQTMSVAQGGGWLALVTALLTAATLLYFQFSRRRSLEEEERAGWRRPVWLTGRVVLTITLGSLFAGALNTGLVLFAERVTFYVGQIWQLIDGWPA